MKDLGIAEVILGIKINGTSEGIILSQSHDIGKSLRNLRRMITIYRKYLLIEMNR